MMNIPHVRLGTSSWKFEDWKGVFYSRTGDELAHYARFFNTVEIDSTWYATPSRRVVESWRNRVPEDFRFAAKVPRVITHDKALVDCEDELTAFLDTMEVLEDRLGPLLFQFPPDWTAPQGEDALRQLLPTLPSDRQFAMEFRHESWFHDRYAELLREYSIAWTLADVGHFVPQVYVTAPFAYIRWLGNRYDETLKPYNSIKKDREVEEEHWAHIIAELPVREVWGYFNNHWAGYSPASAQAFGARLGLEHRELPERQEPSEQGTLF
jgi:uncharacterized protein YecE (DUF72 family)